MHSHGSKIAQGLFKKCVRSCGLSEGCHFLSSCPAGLPHSALVSLTPRIGVYKLTATNLQPLSPTDWKWALQDGGGDAAGKTLPGPLAPQPDAPLCQHVISDKEFCFSRSDGSAWLSKLAQSSCCVAGSGGGSSSVQGPDKLLLHVMSNTVSYCVSGPTGVFCCAVNPAQAPTVDQTREEAPTVCQAPPTCCVQYKFPL